MMRGRENCLGGYSRIRGLGYVGALVGNDDSLEDLAEELELVAHALLAHLPRQAIHEHLRSRVSSLPADA